MSWFSPLFIRVSLHSCLVVHYRTSGFNREWYRLVSQLQITVLAIQRSHLAQSDMSAKTPETLTETGSTSEMNSGEANFEEAKFKGNVRRSYRIEHGVGKNKSGLGGLVFDRSLVSSYLPDADKRNEDKQYPFIIYPWSEGACVPTKFVLKPLPTIPMTYYSINACEGHSHDLLKRFTSTFVNMTPRAQHAGTLLLMSAVHLARNMKLDEHRAAIWLSIVWQCYQLITNDRTRDHVHLERYFEEALLRHCVNSSPQGSEVFTADEARTLQTFFCRFIRLLPLMQLYLFKVFDLELNLVEKRPYLRGLRCASETNLQFVDTMVDEITKMNLYNRPKRDKGERELLLCTEVTTDLPTDVNENILPQV